MVIINVSTTSSFDDLIGIGQIQEGSATASLLNYERICQRPLLWFIAQHQWFRQAFSTRADTLHSARSDRYPI
jgi:hypothetical protein